MTAHHPECAAQATLFDDAPAICTCPGKWLKAQAAAERKAARAEAKFEREAAKAKRVAEREAKRPKPNPCLGAAILEREVPTEHWAVRFPFTNSKTQMTRYCEAKRHKIPKKVEGRDPETGELITKDTFDERGMRQLRKNYPKDPLYPLAQDFTILKKGFGYVPKMYPDSDMMGPDGYLRDQYKRTPLTLRLAMKMLQTLPKPERDKDNLVEGSPERIYDGIRKCFIPSEGRVFVALDFANIEPLLVAYYARDNEFLRACRTSSHSWFAASVIGKPTDFSLSDADITAYYHELAQGGPYLVSGKQQPWKAIRDGCKTAGMTSLYAGGPGEIANANPAIFPTKTVAKYYQDAFFALAPKVRAWHWAQAETIERQGYLRTPIGFRLYANEAFTYAKGSDGRWQRDLSPVSKEVIAALPQHTGAMYLATAAVAFATERPDLAQWVRLLIHDEIFGDVPSHLALEWARVLGSVMSRPHPLMPLDWLSPQERAVMGDHLAVAVESKMSADSWGAMA